MSPTSSTSQGEPVDPTGLREELERVGLNLFGAVGVSQHDATAPPERSLGSLLPGARSAIVVGNGGRSFWSAFRRAAERRPEVSRRRDPLDAFTRDVVERAVAAHGPAGGRLCFPFEFPDVPLSFVHLAECAGLGRRGRLGILLHPEFGPWIALRAALVLPFDVRLPRPADGFDPCSGCVERACMGACPAGAVDDAGWNVPRCVAHRLREPDDCAERCHARFDCVLGRDHRYDPDALAHHQAAARRVMVKTAPR